MSKAGIQSNRGDGYQTLVAFDWALTVLSDPNYKWLEIDSTTWSVDDVVIGKADGTKICCQCKKNQTGFKSWTVSDLADELEKANKVLSADCSATVRFYSRNNFGELAALKEHNASYEDEAAYQAGLGKAQKEVDTRLEGVLGKHAPNISTYEFLQRTSFNSTDELDRMQTLLRERLRQLVSRPSAAYDALWTCLDHLGMRINVHDQNLAVRHRLTKDDLKTLLAQAGALLVPPLNIAEIQASFNSTSAIGRAWRRDIGDERIPSSLVEDLMAAIEARKRSILVTGAPGSGKTCVMLDLQETLERRAHTRGDMQPLFVQSREFADMVTAQERQVQGLPVDWVEKAARMADVAHVVVVIDSLDVLSIAREHSVLTYFLAQIDRLLLIPNITVVTACREFDRHYDRKIAQRNWDKEFTCRPLDWKTEIEPLFSRMNIDAFTIDAVTRELIRNPRELALFVELAQRDGSFNVITSQALAVRYLVTIVQADSALGEAAMQAIESIATEMLKMRSLTVPKQRFRAPQEVLRALLSHNVLHEGNDGKLAFGHQTLLDVLVVSGAIRQGMTLNEFIQTLPPVPFVRPSIRSFFAHLINGDRRELRKQVRTVLAGNTPFHIRRLVAETFAGQVPHDEDWPLLRDLRNHHRDVFQVIYIHATRVEWHYFWFKNLLPVLKDTRDAEGLKMHMHKVSQWINDDAAGIISFWADTLTLDWIDKKQIVWQLEAPLSNIDQQYSTLITPLLTSLIKFPRDEHSLLGRALASCVQSGGMNDSLLWEYIIEEVNTDDLLKNRLNNKLKCQPHDFSDKKDNFLLQRMQQSVTLLELAVASVERWSEIKRQHFGYTSNISWTGFLIETSYNDKHSQTYLRNVDSERNLMDAIEAAIVHHGTTQSNWWQRNCERICFNSDGALRYFGILACTKAPANNLGLVSRLLCDKALLESRLSYELADLMQTAFPHLQDAEQNAIQASILKIHQETDNEPRRRVWVLLQRAQFILTIPSQLRSSTAQFVLNECENLKWPLVRQPRIERRGGMVSAPFSFDIFLSVNNDAILRLLDHYNGYIQDRFDDFLSGGKEEVGRQLEEAASRSPNRFLNLLSQHWPYIIDYFRDKIMDGVATYLAYRHGNLRHNGVWSPVEEPCATLLAHQILDELDRHASHWSRNHSASNALRACAYVVQDMHDIERLVFLTAGFMTLQEEKSLSNEEDDLTDIGIGMMKGQITESLMILSNNLLENKIAWPELLEFLLLQLAADQNPAVRALLLQHLPYLQSLELKFGWSLFDLAMKNNAPGLWAKAEPCLYHAYHENYEIVEPQLSRIYQEGDDKDLETWARLSALAALSEKNNFSLFLMQLESRRNFYAWHGATEVWVHPQNFQQCRELCLTGINAGLSTENPYALVVARGLKEIFQDTQTLNFMPIELIRRYFSLLETEEEESTRKDIFGWDEWLNAQSNRDPSYALAVTEIFLAFIQRVKPFLYDRDKNFPQLLTRLFAQAEEQEELDDGEMLRRVVAVQDTLLALGVNEVSEWLKDAERP